MIDESVYYFHYIRKKDSLNSYGFDESFLLINNKKTFEDSYTYLNVLSIENNTESLILNLYESSNDQDAINFLNTYYEEIAQTSAERKSITFFWMNVLAEEMPKIEYKLSNTSTTNYAREKLKLELAELESIQLYLLIHLLA